MMTGVGDGAGGNSSVGCQSSRRRDTCALGDAVRGGRSGLANTLGSRSGLGDAAGRAWLG